MKPFCEIVVSSILPAVRVLITKELVQTYGLSQTKAASILGITQPAISQYSKELRGLRVQPLQTNKKVMNAIKKVSAEIASGNVKSVQLHEKFCEICEKIRKEKIVCRMHGISPDAAPCDFCFR